jgi:hypothetical protein
MAYGSHHGIDSGVVFAELYSGGYYYSQAGFLFLIRGIFLSQSGLWNDEIRDSVGDSLAIICRLSCPRETLESHRFILCSERFYRTMFLIQFVAGIYITSPKDNPASQPPTPLETVSEHQ